MVLLCIIRKIRICQNLNICWICGAASHLSSCHCNTAVTLYWPAFQLTQLMLPIHNTAFKVVGLPFFHTIQLSVITNVMSSQNTCRQEAKGRDSGMGSGKVWELALVLGTSWSASTLSAHCPWGCQCQHKRSLRYSNMVFITHVNEHCVVDFYWLLSVIINCLWAAKIVQNVGSTGLCRWPTTTTEGPCHIPLCRSSGCL